MKVSKKRVYPSGKYEGGNHKIYLNKENERYIQDLLDCGDYKNLEDVIDTALNFHKEYFEPL